MITKADLRINSPRELDYFLGDNQTVALEIQKPGATPIEVKGTEYEELGVTVPNKVMESLRSVSQLGLKEKWIKADAPDDHNRWVHSQGAAQVGYIWTSAITDRVPDECFRGPIANADIAKIVVSTALLLHDYGHLPFSHLINEALASINWLPGGVGCETQVLALRLRKSHFDEFWSHILNEHLGDCGMENPNQVREFFERLIGGRCGLPWIQTIVNSAIDADKIDYLRFDSHLLQSVDYPPVRTRMQVMNPHQWLTDFLVDQEVTAQGMIALHGRSARATADLWRERVALYDRFYLAPELRVPDRIALEILQLYLIHSVMSNSFLASNADGDNVPDSLLHSLNEKPGIDTINAKYDIVLKLMENTVFPSASTERELVPLTEMHKNLSENNAIDQTYRDFLADSFEALQSLSTTSEQYSLRTFAERSIVREPFVFHRELFPMVRDLLRPFQHRYCREVMIDLIKLPRVLAAPCRFQTGFHKTSTPGVDYTILVPQGDASSWRIAQKAMVPLCDESVASLENPSCRITLVAPNNAQSSTSAYIWDRVRSTLLDSGIELLPPPREVI